MNATNRKRPLISANMVTLARLVPMPVLCWLIYDGIHRVDTGQIWIALVLGTVIGSTDFVDGYLARKHGPTILGGLLDPIADKVFIGFAYVPFADMGIIPAWAVALMFVRELLVTALRSAYEQRGLTMKTSYLGKVKTWTQMQGIGILLLFLLLDSDQLWWLFVPGVILPILALIALWVIKKRFWLGAVVMSASFVLLLGLNAKGDNQLTMSVIMIVVVAMTWLSGFDYVVTGFTQLRGRGDFRRADAVRLAGALALPILIFTALTETAMPAWALITVLSFELAVGGLDNLLSHHHVALGARAWGIRVLGTSAILAASLVFPDNTNAAIGLGAAASLLCVGGVSFEFWRGRDYYVDARLRREQLDTESAA